MKILLDECVDQRFRKDLHGHDVSTVRQMGWAGKKNGELLILAAQSFQVFITVDRNLYFQQNLSKFNIAVVILAARSNHVVELRPLVPEVLNELTKIQAGEVKVIGNK